MSKPAEFHHTAPFVIAVAIRAAIAAAMLPIGPALASQGPGVAAGGAGGLMQAVLIGAIAAAAAIGLMVRVIRR
jgi:hypothetical protein